MLQGSPGRRKETATVLGDTGGAVAFSVVLVLVKSLGIVIVTTDTEYDLVYSMTL